MINHRGPEFAAVLRDIEEGLRWALRTANDAGLPQFEIADRTGVLD